MHHDPTIPMPPVRRNRGYTDLPWSQQLVGLCWLLLISLSLLPALILPSALTSDSIFRSIRRPQTLDEAVQRLDHHQQLVWQGRSNELEQRVHRAITALIALVICIGAAAGVRTTSGGKTKHHGSPLCFGNASPVRVRAILHRKGGSDANTATL